MNKYKLFKIISVISSLIILISLISIMVLTPSVKKNNIKQNQIDENNPFAISTNFTLKTISNNHLSSDTLRGKFIFIYFGSTYCPHICLPNLVKMKTILTLLKNQHNNNLIEFIFITTDPKNDTSEHLKNYFNKLEPKIIPLTGTKEQIDLVLKNFKVYRTLFNNNTLDKSQKNKIGTTDCNISASSPFYLIDQNGKLIKRYNSYSASLNVAKDISHYIKIS
ncbi:MAG: SCO family protein [Rickettsiales bacterium]|nr:SCO family protein [Rickettsiales bacterium]